MPKIIEDLRQKLLFETKRQIDEKGYKSLTVRSVASAVGVGVGTVYNYFPSKDMLIASLVLSDWRDALDKIKDDISDKKLEGALRCIYDSLWNFTKSHERLFSDTDAKKVYRTAFLERHKQLRMQLSELILPLCDDKDGDSRFYAEFVIEALLTWSMEQKDFESILKALKM